MRTKENDQGSGTRNIHRKILFWDSKENLLVLEVYRWIHNLTRLIGNFNRFNKSYTRYPRISKTTSGKLFVILRHLLEKHLSNQYFHLSMISAWLVVNIYRLYNLLLIIFFFHLWMAIIIKILRHLFLRTSRFESSYRILSI